MEGSSEGSSTGFSSTSESSSWCMRWCAREGIPRVLDRVWEEEGLKAEINLRGVSFRRGEQKCL